MVLRKTDGAGNRRLNGASGAEVLAASVALVKEFRREFLVGAFPGGVRIRARLVGSEIFQAGSTVVQAVLFPQVLGAEVPATVEALTHRGFAALAGAADAVAPGLATVVAEFHSVFAPLALVLTRSGCSPPIGYESIMRDYR